MIKYQSIDHEREKKTFWNWSSGYGEIENLKSLQMTDDRWSEKLNLAFSSSELTKTKKNMMADLI